MRRIPTAALIRSELSFLTSRSSGPGGQNVNKVNSKVTLQFDLQHSAILTEDEKSTIQNKLKSRINTDGVLTVVSQEGRSQLANRENVLKKLDLLLKKAFEVRKTRKPTKPGKSAVSARLNKKKLHSDKKKLRQKPL